MQPYLVRIVLAVTISVPLLGCHGRSNDRGGLVNVRTQNGVQVRAPFVNVDVATPNSGESEDLNIVPEPLPPPAEMALPE